MGDNMDLFSEEIEELRMDSNLEKDLFMDVLRCTRDAVDVLGSKIVPATVIDIIEGAVEFLGGIHDSRIRREAARESVQNAVNRLGFEEVDLMFDESLFQVNCNEFGKSVK